MSAGKISSDFSKAIGITSGAGKGSFIFPFIVHRKTFFFHDRSCILECVAVAARSEQKAAQFAKIHEIPKSYGSYDDLLHDPDIDVVYIGSIADQHAQMAKKSLLAGKPTVVEKPLTLSAKDTLEIVQLARNKNVFML